MRASDIMTSPVVAGDRVVGIVARRDLLVLVARGDQEVRVDLERRLEQEIELLRGVRVEVADMAWRGLPVPALYAGMAAEFQDLVATGEYAAWIANGGGPGTGSPRTRAARHLTPGAA